VQVSQGVMLRGAGIDSLWPALLVLVGMAVVVFGSAVWRFRASITPRRPRGARSTAAVAR
jgi:ABC-2 type transport system permease protein